MTHPDLANLPPTLSVPAAAKVLGIGRGTGYEAARSGQLPTIRLGRRVLVPRAALLELLGEIPVSDRGADVQEVNPNQPRTPIP